MIRKLEMSMGDFILVTRFWPSQMWFPLLLQLRVIDVFRLLLHPDILVNLMMGQPPIIDDCLVAWRISREFRVSVSPTEHFDSSRVDGVPLPSATTMGSDEDFMTFSISDDFLSMKSI